MQFRLRCKNCDTTLKLTEKSLGRTIACPHCDEPIRVPAAPASSGASPKQRPADDDDDVPASPRSRSTPAARTKSSKSKSRKQQSPVMVGAAVGAGLTVFAGLIIWIAVKAIPSAPANPPTAVAKTETPQPAPQATPPASPAQQQPAPVVETKAEPAAATTTVASTIPAAAAVSATKELKNPAAKPDSPPEQAAPKAAPAEPSGPPDLATLIDRAGRSLVLIRIKDANGQDRGLGSGFIIDKNGLVATNYHVMGPAASAEAEFRDGSRVPVSGYRAFDEKRDLAIVQLQDPPADLEPLEFATASEVRQGSSVIAMGHPRGLRFTATEGIVSAIHKASELPEDLRGDVSGPDDQVWIQTNATIFSGNSGGPLLSRAGKVVGINSWITRDVNFGFAMAIQHLIDLMPKMTDSAIPLADVNRQKSLHESWLGMGPIDPEVNSIIEEYKRGMEEFIALLSRAKTREDYEKIFKTKNPSKRHAPRLVKFAAEKSKSPAAYQALVFAITMIPQFYPEADATPHLQQATSQLIRDHITEKTLGSAAMMLAECKLPGAQQFLRDLLKKSPERDVQGVACYVLGRSMSDAENVLTKKEAIKFLERAVEEYGNVKYHDTEISELAAPLLFALQHLSIGSPAPEIVGHDVDGEEFKLSDYRGKVVMLDFFVNWCPHCTKMYPLERMMVEKTKDQPCVLLGINCDERGVLRNIINEKRVTWQCWADGPSGPISTQWRVDSFPRIYIIDHEGIIRHQFNGFPDPDEVDRILTQLVKAATEKGKANPRKPRKS